MERVPQGRYTKEFREEARLELEIRTAHKRTRQTYSS
jgi:hypothetical protein